MTNPHRAAPSAEGRAPTSASRSIFSAVWALVLFFGIACAQPAAAQFSPKEGFNDDGSAKVTFDLNPYLYLPHSQLKIGLDRPAGEDITIGRPRPTIAQAVSSLAGAFDCDCLLRFGNWSGEIDVLYLSLKNKESFPPLPPSLPAATLNTKASTFYIQPGIGYRVVSSDVDHASIDVRAGFIYESLSADADFQAGEFAGAANHTLSLTQPWIGERMDWFPTSKWRLENTFDITGLGVDGGVIGWQGKLSASYLFTKWFDLQIGYLAQQTTRNVSILPNGTDRSANVLLYGPMVALGFRF